jgi:fatty acid desaturase
LRAVSFASARACVRERRSPIVRAISGGLIDYAAEVRRALPPEVFAPARSRLAWLPVHVTVIVACTLAIGSGVDAWIAALLAVPIGCSFAGLALLGHEVMHGAVIRGRSAIQTVGWICFAPFMLSPRLWSAWHNRVHHQHTMRAGVDPDAYPTLAEYQRSFLLRAVGAFSLGRNRPLGLTSVLLGFTVQSLHVLVAARGTVGLSPQRHRIAIMQSLFALAGWVALAIALGPYGFLFAYGIPILIANAIVMTYILTNHNLSPLTDRNDALLNSLSVTTPRWYAFLTLSFGLHVEHHVVPTMSSRHAWRVREVLLARWPDRYQSMPLLRALWRLLRTARVYRHPTVLHDPWTGREWPTLGRTEAAPPSG